MTDAPQNDTKPLIPPEKPLVWKASGKGGAVAAGGHPAAVTAGMAMLETGGNAADAAVATILAESVTDYGMFAIGGEVPLIFHDAQRSETTVLSGLGAAPHDPNAIGWYMENGIPTGQDIKASPVPGALGLCVTAMQRFGRLTFEQAAAPALALLDAGDKEWHVAQGGTFRKLVEAERSASGHAPSTADAAGVRPVPSQRRRLRPRKRSSARSRRSWISDAVASGPDRRTRRMKKLCRRRRSHAWVRM